eukprot:TRINITY_DN8076_c0_g1_i1.p2 TRINITY_DN8076_c0_g1~~TRINITY_DN8076_c0_g1_i1.p2  ORF type:complete len:355 (-),score=83.15 TRINITY_DN8076_c0_g1_i1:28-1092(-)
MRAFLLLLSLFAVSWAQLRLIELNETQRVWMKPEDVLKLAKECGAGGQESGFMDVTDYPSLGNGFKYVANIPSGPSHQGVVMPLLELVEKENMKNTVEKLSSYPTRYYQSETAEEAVDYLIEEFKKHSAHRDDIQITKFTNKFKQSSIIVRMEGEGDSDETVVLGCHLDSISNSDLAPGADDDASGTSTVLEVFRILSTQNFKPKRSIEFHGYAGEELGLLGSQAIAAKYQSEGRPVAGMLQFDMTGYVRSDTQPQFGIVTDYTDKDMSTLIRALAETYTTTPWKNTVCGYGCSDHASWFKAGYPSAFSFEETFESHSPYIHTTSDLLKYLNLDHMAEFARLGLGYLVEMSLTE